MAAGDRVQKGQQWKVEFGSFAYSGYSPRGLTSKLNADDAAVQDHRKATVTHMLTNPRREISLDLMIQSAGSITPPAKGDYITITTPEGVATKFYVDDASVSFSDDITMLSLSLLREDSMAATYDA